MSNNLNGAANPQPTEAKPKKRAKKAGEIPPGAPAPAANNANPIVSDETYGELRQENRVVMRHTIALNLESFRAAPDDFVARPQRAYPTLNEVAPPLLSVVIPTYNGMRHMEIVLAALAEQSFTDFEIIVVDDASSDDTVTWIEHHHPNVRLIVNRHNAGFVAACNTGAAAARGRYVVHLNNDTEPEPRWLEALTLAILANPNAAIAGSKLLLFDQRDTLHSAGDMMGIDGVPRNRGVWERDTGQYDQAPSIFSACGGAAAYRKDVWEALGGFDEDLWMYLEDVDYAFRVRLLGYEVIFAPEARVFHRLSASGGGELASYYVGRNTIWVIVKNMPRGLLLRNAPQILSAQIAIAVDALRNIRGKAAQARLRGQFDALRGLPAQLAKRRKIQPRRQIEDGDLAAQLQA